MKILIVSYWFPPQNVIGAVRVGKFASYLHRHGHDVRVVTGNSPEADRSLPLEIPVAQVAAVEGWNIDDLFEPVLSRIRPGQGSGRADSAAPSRGQYQSSAASDGEAYSQLRDFLRRQYYAALRIPDSKIGWRGAAIRAGEALMVGNWRPEIILASAPPFTALLVAREIARRHSVPWVAELRDLWTDNPYYEHPGWRRFLDGLLERRVLNSAAALVSVTPLWSDTLRRKYGKPTYVVLNGYVPEDYPEEAVAPAEFKSHLAIVYTGNIYRGYRDPSSLFAAVAGLGDERDSVRVHFYGPSADDVLGLAAKHGVESQVVVHSRVSYRRSLELQMSADILLLMQWNNRADEGNIPAKFFEYLAARRPILFLGYEHGTLAQMIRDRQAGFVSNDPAEIAGQLSRWIVERRAGGVMALPATAKLGLARDDQFSQLAVVLGEMAAAH